MPRRSAPTVSREFAAGTPLSLYVEAYDNANGREPRTIALKVEVRDGEGHVVRSAGDRRTRAAKGIDAFLIAVPLDVDAGSYVLHVVATSGEASVSRAIPIRVH